MQDDPVVLSFVMAFVVLDVLYPLVAICHQERRACVMTAHQYHVDLFVLTWIGVAFILCTGWYVRAIDPTLRDPVMVAAGWLAAAAIAIPIADIIGRRMVYVSE